MDYHAHVYWTSPQQQETALLLRDALMIMGCSVGRLHAQPIGPHPLPMFQALYNTDTRESVESVICNMRKDLSVLLHEAINDDVRDHTMGARWLGPQLELDLDWLETYQQQKEKKHASQSNRTR